MVSYALLVVIAVAISAGVYSYLKLYVPVEGIECDADTSLIIDDIICYKNGLNITVSNRGFFNVSAGYVRVSAEGRKVRTQVNPGLERFVPQLAPEAQMQLGGPIPTSLKYLPGYTLEVQAGTIAEDGLVYPCKGAIVTQNFVCTG